MEENLILLLGKKSIGITRLRGEDIMKKDVESLNKDDPIGKYEQLIGKIGGLNRNTMIKNAMVDAVKELILKVIIPRS